MVTPIQTRFPYQTFAPLIYFSGGAEYATKKEDKLLYISPLTSKMTFVLDQRLVTKDIWCSEGGI
jgi:hypothetical protein